MQKKLFGMVTTAKSARYTEHALRSFFENTTLADKDRFLLIDNDGGYELPLQHPQLELHRNATPLGFAENGNQLIDLANKEKADLFFLNNDIILTPNWLEPLLVDNSAIMTPLSNREVQYNFGDISFPMIMQLDDYFGKEAALKDLVTAHRSSAQGQLKVTVLPFFCVRIPYLVLSSIGHFDTSFGKAGAEDYDYCLRAFLGGFSVKYALQSYVLHFGGKSSYSGAETKEQQDERELKFRSMFGYKWGMQLLKLILFEDREILREGTPLAEEIKKGNHRYVIECLKGDKECAVSMWYHEP